MLLVKPYYQHAGITIYHGDCREVLGCLAVAVCRPCGCELTDEAILSIHLAAGHAVAPLYTRVLTDQPYGTGFVTASAGDATGEWTPDRKKPAWDVWDPSWLQLVRKAETVASFCPISRLSDFLNEFPRYSLRFYVKNNPRPACQKTDSPSVEPCVISPSMPFGNGPQHYICHNAHETEHPTEKPQRVMRWMVRGVSAPGETILDPFMGSGTTLLAAKREGRHAIGIEISERYCEIAAERLSQEVMQFDAEPVSQSDLAL